jgi:hypothetical protein
VGAFSRDFQPRRTLGKVVALHITQTDKGYSMAVLEKGSETLRELIH